MRKWRQIIVTFFKKNFSSSKPNNILTTLKWMGLFPCTKDMYDKTWIYVIFKQEASKENKMSVSPLKKQTNRL